MANDEKIQLYKVVDGSRADKYPATKIAYVESLQTELDKKVAKDGTKVLSTNDFTDAFKTKLDGIDTSATADTITLNGTATKTPTFYAPTSAGQDGNVVGISGGVPTWVSISSALRFKGAVDNLTDLPTTGQAVGDVYTIRNQEYDNYVYEGTSTGTPAGWTNIGHSVDLTAYQLKNVETSGTSHALISDTNGNIAVSTVTATELGRLAGCQKDIQNEFVGIESGTIAVGKLSTSAGSTNVPVYFVDGKPVQMTIELNDAAKWVGGETGATGSIPCEAAIIDGVSKGFFTKLGSSDVGSATKLAYLALGVPTESTANVGVSDTTNGVKPVYLKEGVITAVDQTIGSTQQLTYLNAGTITKGISITYGTADPTTAPAGGVGSIYIKYTS